VQGSTKPQPSFDFLDQHPAKKMQNFADFSFDERDEDKPAASEQYKQYDYDFFSSLELQFMSKPVEQAGGKSFSQKMLTRRTTAAMLAPHGDEWIDESADKKPDESSEQSDSSDESDESEPEVPRDYTRGKWKPGSRPPATFTGGKWKPAEDENESSCEAVPDEADPPPTHTRGKWVPGTKITKLEFKEADKDNNQQLWCSFCSRNLATRAIYERHLRSNLHRKRTRQQDELEEAAEALPLTSLDELATQLTPTSEPKSEAVTAVDEEGAPRARKFRSRSRVTCEECELRLPAHRLGLHLISHFHYRKMLRHPRKSFDSVLTNFHKIVVQSPFQCAPCKFYFNSHEELLRHWNSNRHVARVEELEVSRGRWLCASCKFDCDDHETMTSHLGSAEHQQVVALMNRSKPIVVRRLTLLTCSKCDSEFRYNAQLMRHLRTCEKPANSEFRFADGNLICDDCGKAFQSALSLQRHKIKAHESRVFFCSECQKTFASADEAKAHRKTSLHKTLVARKRMLGDPELQQRLQKTCPVCKQQLLDVMELRAHILQEHPEHKFR
jgi:Zinc-finger of C2H2 type